LTHFLRGIEDDLFHADWQREYVSVYPSPKEDSEEKD